MITRRRMKKELDHHFERVRQTAHSIVDGQRADVLNLPMSDRWQGFYENTRRLGRDYLQDSGKK